MDKILEKLEILNQKLKLQKEELRTLEQEKKENDIQIDSLTYKPNKVEILQSQLGELKIEKEIAENKPKKLKESKIEYLKASLGVIFISAIACFGIAAATYLFVEIFPLLYTLLAGLGATVGVAGFLEIFPTSSYIDRKKYIKELDLDAINKKIVEKSQKLEFEMSKQNNNNDLIMLK